MLAKDIPWQALHSYPRKFAESDRRVMKQIDKIHNVYEELENNFTILSETLAKLINNLQEIKRKNETVNTHWKKKF